MSIIIGIGPPSGRMPPALENVAGSFSIASSAAYGGDAPYAVLLVEVHGRVLAHPRVLLVRIVDVEAAVEQVDVVAGRVRRHALTLPRRYLAGPLRYFGGIRIPASMRITSPLR